ncbi:MAG: HNH endonuclease, partial [Pseudomonadota bacterium]|nr:HNH endonuclease [Pseudomonadota bacterium]
LPRKIVNHDKLWNLVLAHSYCNEAKSDKLVSSHFIEKLIKRNENIIGSRISRRKELILQLGKNIIQRRAYIENEYGKVRTALRNNFWGGVGYNPETDPFYRRLITIMNNN